MIKKNLYRVLEEILPFIPFVISSEKILRNIQDEKYTSGFDEYELLGSQSIGDRLAEEHSRGTKIDEKTSKFTLGLSVSLTVLAAASGSIAKLLPNSELAMPISIICGIASLYMLGAGIIALGALKTLMTFGFGTPYQLKVKAEDIPHMAKSLFLQERVNLVRHQRNEAAYQMLRNGFFMLFIALVVSVVSLSMSHPIPSVSDTPKLISTESQDGSGDE